MGRLRGGQLASDTTRAPAILQGWLAADDPLLAQHAALLLAEAGYLTLETLAWLAQSLCASDDLVRHRAGQALELKKERRASQLGRDVVERMALQAWEAGKQKARDEADGVVCAEDMRPFDVRVSTRMGWALNRIEHDDGALLRSWIGALTDARLDDSDKIAILEGILSKIRQVTSDAFPEVVSGLLQSPARVQRALLDSVGWLLRDDNVPEAQYVPLVDVAGDLAVEAADEATRAGAVECLGHARRPSSREIKTLLTCLDSSVQVAVAACPSLARLLARLRPSYDALASQESLRKKLGADLGKRDWSANAAGDAVDLLLTTSPFRAAESVGDVLGLLAGWQSIPDVEKLIVEVARQDEKDDEQIERRIEQARAALQKLRESTKFPGLLAALQDAHAHPNLLSEAKSALQHALAHGDETVVRAAGGALCRLALTQAPGADFQPGPTLSALSEPVPAPVNLLRALLQAGTDDDEWNGERKDWQGKLDYGYHARAVGCVRALVESQPALLEDLLNELEIALEKPAGDEGWPARRIALAAVAAVAGAMPAHFVQARPPEELETLLVRGTTDAGSFTARRMALTALSHLRVVTSRVVPALLAAVQDMHRVQQDAIAAAARFRRVEADALPALMQELYHPSAAVAHTVALILAELGAGRQALDEQELRRSIAQALADGLADPANHREVWIDKGGNIALEGWLDETLFSALNRVVG